MSRSTVLILIILMISVSCNGIDEAIQQDISVQETDQPVQDDDESTQDEDEESTGDDSGGEDDDQGNSEQEDNNGGEGEGETTSIIPDEEIAELSAFVMGLGSGGLSLLADDIALRTDSSLLVCGTRDLTIDFTGTSLDGTEFSSDYNYEANFICDSNSVARNVAAAGSSLKVISSLGTLEQQFSITVSVSDTSLIYAGTSTILFESSDNDEVELMRIDLSFDDLTINPNSIFGFFHLFESGDVEGTFTFSDDTTLEVFMIVDTMNEGRVIVNENEFFFYLVSGQLAD